VQPVILDTDVASLTHKRKLTGPLATRLIGRKPLITFVTFGELPRSATGAPAAARNSPTGSPASRSCPATSRSRRLWGRLSAAGIRRGRPRPINDMWIAACCLTYDLPLATLNLKDYEDFKTHHGLRILGTE
jgi:predicted nucleic acid-binding protein